MKFNLFISLGLSILFIGCANDTSTYQTEIKQPIKPIKLKQVKQAIKQIKQPIKPKPIKYYTLNIITKPKNAKIEFEYLNKKYKPNMKLKAGDYSIKVSAKFYNTEYKTIYLDSNKKIFIFLQPNFDVDKEFRKKIHSFAGNINLNFMRRNIVIDRDRKFMWQDDKSLKSQKKMNWYQARKYCKNLKLAGFYNWRLPTIQELSTIVDYNRYNPAILKKFKNVNSDYYWTDSRVKKDIIKQLNFNNGYNSVDKCNSKAYVRCINKYNIRDYLLLGKMYENEEVQRKSLDKLLYTKHPFSEISRLTNMVLKIWLEPRKIDKAYFLLKIKKFKKLILPPEIKKPSLPPIPKLVKSQFETKKMFEKRVNEAIVKRDKKIKQFQVEYRQKVEKRNQQILNQQKEYNKKIKQLQKQYNDEIVIIKKEQEYKKSILPQKIKEFQKGAFKVVMGTFYFTNPKYDAENQTMYVNLKSSRSSYQKRVALSVPLNIAKNFYDNIKNIKADVKFDFDKNKITLNSINAIYDDKTYMAKLTDKDFKPEKVEVVLKDKKVNFKADKNAKLNLKNIHLETTKPIKLTLQNPNLKDYYQVDGVVYQDGKKVSGKKYNDDIPTLLAHTKQAPISNKKWLFVIGIEKYDNTDNIAYASRTAKLFTKVMQKKLGISKRHTYFLLDNKATTARVLNNLKLMLREVKPGDTIYFYYNGHGIPDPRKGGEPYILPSDQIPDFVVENKDLMLKQIYTKLSNSKARKVVAFVDSCFSGTTDGKSVIKGVAATRLVPKKVTFNHKKMVVLTAGRDKEYSNAYPQKGERLFSYYVMKSILKGRKDIKSLYSEVYIKVKDTSNSFGPLKVQEPTISGNKDMKL